MRALTHRRGRWRWRPPTPGLTKRCGLV
jgi:hypothetical protein